MLPLALLRSDLLLALEFCAIAGVLVLGWFMPGSWRRRSRWWWRRLNWVGQRQWLSIILGGLVASLGSALVALLVRFPEPVVHDEFSYLLAADTFAHGRLANPPHPMWPHFESFHIIQQPTYASKYPPAQGLMLAVGQVIGGHAIVGVWLSIGIACGSICWMLRGWLPPRWSVLGGLLAAMHLGFFGYWSQNYWGGAVAAIGGSLLFGSLRRVVRAPSAGMAIVMGLGLAVLANSRPFEGLVASVPAALLLFLWTLSKNGPGVRSVLRRIVLPICLILGMTAGAMAYYNFRVTGVPWRMPYQVYQESYSSVPIFLSGELGPRLNHRHRALRDFDEEWARRTYLERRTLRGFMTAKVDEFLLGSFIILRPVFLIPLVMLPFVLRNRWWQFALLAVVLVLAVLLLQAWSSPRKVAPVTCLFVGLVVQSIRCLGLDRRSGKRIGRLVAHAIPMICLCSLLASFLPSMHHPRWSMVEQRVRILDQLGRDDGRHLVIVRYLSGHSVHCEWVYNRADIDAATVVWAREMDPAQNRQLLDYFDDRKAWLLEVGGEDSRVELISYLAD